MRNLLALLAAFTLSTSSAVTAVACGTADQTTVVIFDWNGVINGEQNKTADDMYKFLLDNTDTGIGQSLYKDIVDYISLSILKTNSTFAEDYEFAKQSVENQIKNIQDSLRSKYGRSWETQWKNFLKDPAQGGDGATGSYQRYFDVLLKGKANTIVSQYYVGDNYHNYEYYNTTEITIWLNDIYKFVHPGGELAEYINTGTYGDKVWIVAKSFNQTDLAPFALLQTAIRESSTPSNIKLAFKVAKTKNDEPKQPGDDYLVDPSSTIQGLLSNQQAKIAQVWMKNQGPIWTRQIVVPFKDTEKNNALKDKIELSNFNETELSTVIKNINNPSLGFQGALREQMDEIKSVTTSSTTGDLGLVTLNSDPASIKPSFSYYLYRYVTSAQGVGQQSATTLQYNLSEYTADANNLQTLIDVIDRTTTESTATHTSNYKDLVWMKDADPDTNLHSGSDGNKVAVFIDTDGIHFVQTPGITYSSTVETTTPIQDIITDYTQLLSDPIKRENATWDDVKKLADRPGGLTNTPYLDYLQTQYLLWNTKGLTTFFDLNESLNKFTSGSSDISSDIWWDYILYFNNNIDNIHWNVSVLLDDDINASDDRIYQFIDSMKTWFSSTYKRRWSLQQGIVSNDTLIKNITDLNETWEGKDYANGPAARLDPEDIKIYLNNVAAQTIWYYDPNSIQR
ncbi:hypothetical protein HER12_000298 [Spiroplasma platyhelix PALS-1]|nr:hypothetical protein [Spiroplasma platyhelix PALS-1]UJB29311.1 hypothetical protein SPLAT_v1c05470 [Spiroplasma platyhelix PALS-1]